MGPVDPSSDLAELGLEEIFQLRSVSMPVRGGALTQIPP